MNGFRATAAYKRLFDLLGLTSRSKLVVATTNYDNLAECCLEQVGRLADTGEVRPLGAIPPRPFQVGGLLEGMPRYTPVLHLHGAVGWYRGPDGSVFAVSGGKLNESHGEPVLMLPDPDKDYGVEPVITEIWAQFTTAARKGPTSAHPRARIGRSSADWSSSRPSPTTAAHRRHLPATSGRRQLAPTGSSSEQSYP